MDERHPLTEGIRSKKLVLLLRSHIIKLAECGGVLIDGFDRLDVLDRVICAPEISRDLCRRLLQHLEKFLLSAGSDIDDFIDRLIRPAEDPFGILDLQHPHLSAALNMQECPLPVIVDLQHIRQYAVLIAVCLRHFRFPFQRPDREQDAMAVIRLETLPLRLSE